MKLSYLIFGVLLLMLVNVKVQGQSIEEKKQASEDCLLGKEHLANYQFQKAMESFNVCYQNDLENLNYLKKIAVCNYKLGQFKDSKEIYQKILRKDSVNITALNQLGIIYSKESNYKKALEQYETLIEIDTLNSYYHKRAAEFFTKTNNFIGSVMNYEKAHQLNPKDIEIILALSKVYGQLDELYHPRINDLIYLGMMLDSTNVKLRLLQAKTAYKQKRYSKVIKSVERLLELTTDTSFYALKIYGISCFQTKDHQNAINILEKVIAINPESEVIYYYLGLAYKAIGDYTKSVQYFEKAIDQAVSENLPNYYTNLAIIYEEQGKYKKSIETYKASYKSSKDKILLYHLARNYDMHYKDKKMALQYFEKYMAANDTGNIEYKDYSKHRISELKKVIHFDTVD